MALSLKCSQVMALLNFYVRDKLDITLKNLIKEHLDKCPSCYNKFLALKSLLKKSNNEKFPKNEVDENKTDEVENEEVIEAISAYLDNELGDVENLRVKKLAIVNPSTRKKLEDFYSIKKILFDTIEKDKQDFKYDFSKSIMNMINFKEEINKVEPVLHAVSLFLIILATVVVFAVAVLWV